VSPKMNRRYWFATLVGGLLGFWAARRATPGPARRLPSADPPRKACSVTPDSDGQVMVFRYHAANRVTGVGGPYGTTLVYDAGRGSIRDDG